MASTANYRLDLDLLKGLAIIAVVFYHTGWLHTGYLGVDAFLAINGFFILPVVFRQIGEGRFQYGAFLLKRIMRLWPLILLASAVTLLVGVYGMLPDDFENLSQAVIATDFMSVNILSAITTRDYWDVVNEYKPLMHFWYVGILVEFYILLPLVLGLVRWLSGQIKKDYSKSALFVLWLLFLLSLSLYLFSGMPQGDKFYYLPCRLFELIGGGLVGVYYVKQRIFKCFGGGNVLAILVTTLLMVSGWLFPEKAVGGISPVTGQVTLSTFIPPTWALLTTVLSTCLVLASRNAFDTERKFIVISGVAFLGKMSFSIFVWHQILLAFYRYFVSNDMSVPFVVGLWVVTLGLSLLTYYGIEKRVRPTFRNFTYCVAFMLLTILPAGWVYLNAGVIRDVPELGIKKGEVHRGMFAEYCDRVYQYDRDFTTVSKPKVLVAGVSFGRDFANILLESEWADKVELSYIFTHEEKYKARYEDCDYLFTFSAKDSVPAYVWESLSKEAKVYGLGTKNFGDCNGIVYQKRHDADYYQQTTAINPNFYILNNEWKEGWGKNHYIDFLQLSTAPNGEIRVFSDDHKFISQDCRHLTQSGARWFAKRIDWSSIFNTPEKAVIH